MKIIRISLSLFVCLFRLSTACDAQKEGDTWVIGYYSGGSPNYSIMHLDFRSGDVKLNWHFDEEMQMNETAANICDQNGEAILWTNGMQIFGKNGIYVADTIAFAPGEVSYWNWYVVEDIGPLGFPIHDGAIILPVPEHENEYFVLYHFVHSIPDAYNGAQQYRAARIQMNPDTTFTVLYQDSIFIEYNYLSENISATRHANGRDWWILAMEATGNKYFTYLLDPEGLHLHRSGELEIFLEEGSGQSRFSPKGNYFARLDILEIDSGQDITLFSFNRCNGELHYVDQLNINYASFTGVAFSPSEQYLYADDNKSLWQWDLHSADIAASQTLVDTFDGFVQPGWFPMRFGPMMNGPDGRIYIVPPAGSSEFIHVIDRPDEPAADCRFLQHHIDLKVPNGRSAPNLPNYRLGPIDGSPCDTLDINNVPQAWWRFEEKEPGRPNDIRFTDLSFFDPQVWLWDFGDGQTSEEINPSHTFDDGLYHVCLTVSSPYGQDSMCRRVEILPVSTEESDESLSEDLSISPNPFTDQFEIRSKSGVIRSVTMIIHDMHGREILSSPSAPVPVVMYVPKWTSGMYLVTIRDVDGAIYQFKVMKI